MSIYTVRETEVSPWQTETEALREVVRDLKQDIKVLVEKLSAATTTRETPSGQSQAG